MQPIAEPTRQVPVVAEADVIVAGGGPGGVCAAVGAAKEGASVLLIERYGFLGGMATAGLVNPFMPYKIKGRRLTSAVFNELLDRLQDAGALATEGMVFDDEGMKIVLDQMMQDHGVSLLLHSTLVGVEMDGRCITRVQTVSKSGRIDVTGTMFVDSTGDGDLAAQAGAPVEIGRPKDGLCQPMTLCFRIGGVAGEPGLCELRQELTEIFLAAKEAGEIDLPREDVLIFATMVPHIFHFNTTRVVQRDATDVLDMTAAELEGRRQVAALLDLFKHRSPRFKNAYLIKMAAQIGVRESRRVMGEYVLNVSEVVEACKFEDGIARSNYPVDIHNPTGEGTVIQRLPPGEFYEVPYRCLVPQDVDNLLVGSRCISATHEAHSSLRVMPVVAGIGEAAGVAAAWAAREGVPPREVDGARLKAAILGETDNHILRTGKESQAMTTIALFGAAGKMGIRITDNLKDDPECHLLYVEAGQAGLARLRERRFTPTPKEEAVREADVVILAIPDTLIGSVATGVVPALKSGAIVVCLDPAAPYGGELPEREDITYLVAHPCHPPIINDETDPEARRDFFGGTARQNVVCALMQGPESGYLRGEQIVRKMFAPVMNVHRVTVEQMAILEPALSETVVLTCMTVIRESLDEAIRRGVPARAARDFLLGHINAIVGILFGYIDAEVSDGAKLAVARARERIFQPDWKAVFEPESILREVKAITQGRAAAEES